jgi:hypothetical protein
MAKGPKENLQYFPPFVVVVASGLAAGRRRETRQRKKQKRVEIQEVMPSALFLEPGR